MGRLLLHEAVDVVHVQLDDSVRVGRVRSEEVRGEVGVVLSVVDQTNVSASATVTLTIRRDVLRRRREEGDVDARLAGVVDLASAPDGSLEHIATTKDGGRVARRRLLVGKSTVDGDVAAES